MTPVVRRELEGTLAAPLPWGPWLLGGIMHNAEGEEHPNTR